MEESNAPPPAPTFRDRSAALAFYGWILIAAGALCALMALLFVALLTLARSSGRGPAVAAGGVFVNATVYLGLAAILIALGVGSIRVRRWARSLTLILLWAWLAAGVLGLLVTAVLLPGLLSNQAVGATPPGTATCLMIFTLLFVSLFFVLLPLVLLFFYRREDVRQTVEARDPRPDWTDRVPLSILGIVLALALSAAASIVAVAGTRAVPVFGTVLTGWPAALSLLLLGAVSGFLALAVYRRSAAGWWGLMALQIVGLANILTLRNLDMEALMRQMGYPPEQARLAGQYPLLASPIFFGLMAVAWVALLVFLFTVRKHFRRISPSGAPPAA